MTQHDGRVTWFDPKHGYGFLACSHAANVFVDTEAIQVENRHRLQKGDRVFFDILDSDVGPKACSVSRYKAPGQVGPLGHRYLDSLAERATSSTKLAEEELQVILLIEDTEDVAMNKSNFLRAAGYLVVTCSDIEMACDVYQSNMPIDLVMLALHPPKEVSAYIAELGFIDRRLPVLLSAPVLPLDLWRETRKRAWYFVPAALPMPRLLSTIYRILRPTCLDAA